MSTDTERLFVQLEARVADFDRRMRQAERRGTRTYNSLQRGSGTATRRMEQDMTRATTRMNAALASTTGAVGALSGALRTLGVPLGLAALTVGVRRAVSEMSDLGKAARDAGLNVEELQGLQRGFARAARVSQDDVTAAFERFNRRVGEAVNGTGPLQRVVERYGIQLRGVNGRLRSQGDLLREVARAMQGVTNEQERAAIAQAAFGDVGRRMAVAMAAGPEALETMIVEAREAGDIIDRNLIQRAELLDDRFDELTRRVRTFFRTLAVGAIGGVSATPLETLVEMFGSLERARQALGDDLVEALTAELGVLDRHETAVRNLATATTDWRGELHALIGDIDEVAAELMAMGEVGAAEEMLAIADNLNEAGIALSDGEISAQGFQAALDEAAYSAQRVTSGIEGLNAASLEAIIAQANTLRDALDSAVAAARQIGDEMGTTPGSPLSGFISRGRQAAREVVGFLSEEQRLASRTREQIELEREVGRVRSRALEQGITLTDDLAEAQARANIAASLAARGAGSDSGGGGGGGGAATVSDFDRAVDAIRDRIALLEAEGVALLAAASSGREYSEAIQFAFQRARLLVAAQRDGLAITPELEAAIDRLADSYARAGEEARGAADAIREAEANARAGADAMANLFMGIIEGGDSARRALASLLTQLAQVQAQRAFGILAGMGGGTGGFFSFLGGLTRREHGGSVRAGEPYIVGERRPELFVPGQSGTIVPQVPTGGGEVAVDVRVHVDQDGNWRAAVQKIADKRVHAQTPGIVSQSVRATYAANSEARMR
jgi:hypothetical protein